MASRNKADGVKMPGHLFLGHGRPAAIEGHVIDPRDWCRCSKGAGRDKKAPQ